MPKIVVKNKIVNLNGDEMARVLWNKIENELILPYLELKLSNFDLSITNRDETNDQVTSDAANEIKKINVGLKCATITPDDKRVKEYNLKKKYPSPNGTIRNILKGTIFREPIMINKIPKIVDHWNKPVIIARHAFGDIYRSKEIVVNKKGKLTICFEDENGNKDEKLIHNFETGGVGLAYFNVFESINDFANSCFNFACKRKVSLFLSTKNTILQKYDESFKQIFDDVFKKFKKEFEKNNITYQHRLIDDMVACLMKWSGGFIWACKNYDGDVMSDLVAQGYGSLGLMTSVLQSPDGKILKSEAAHGTITSHFRQHQQGIQTSTNPIASIFAWTRGLAHRGKLDGNEELIKFAETLEKVCVDCVEEGSMTKDLAILIGPSTKYLTTNQFLDTLDGKLRQKLN